MEPPTDVQIALVLTRRRQRGRPSIGTCPLSRLTRRLAIANVIWSVGVPFELQLTLITPTVLYHGIMDDIRKNAI